MRRIVSIFLVFALALSQTGCSAFVPHRQKFSVTTSEPDAKIYINGEFVGAGQVTTKVQRNQSVSVMVKKDGYYPATRDVGTTMSMVGILDIIGGCIILIPLIGLAFPGAKELDNSNVAIVLDKEKG